MQETPKLAKILVSQKTSEEGFSSLKTSVKSAEISPKIERMIMKQQKWLIIEEEQTNAVEQALEEDECSSL